MCTFLCSPLLKTKTRMFSSIHNHSLIGMILCFFQRYFISMFIFIFRINSIHHERRRWWCQLEFWVLKLRIDPHKETKLNSKFFALLRSKSMLLLLMQMIQVKSMTSNFRLKISEIFLLHLFTLWLKIVTHESMIQDIRCFSDFKPTGIQFTFFLNR